MKKYIQRTLDELDALHSGMLANPADWTATPVKETDVNTEITGLTAAGDDITAAEINVSEKRSAGIAKNKASIKIADQVIDLALGIYAANPDKLVEYGIKTRKKPGKVPPPTKTLAFKIDNDSDGEGFEIIMTAKDDVADSYEWQKGHGTDPKDTFTIPPMTFFRQTSKTVFIDDEVLKGIRYFYRVRAVNRNGQGPWSEPVSRVQ